MNHWTEEDQIEHYYNAAGSKAAGLNATGPDSAAREHLEACQMCAEAFAALAQDLSEFEEAEVPVRDDGYGERVWQRLAPQLPLYEVRKRRWYVSPWMQVMGYAAASALMALGAFHAGRMWEKRQQPPDPVAKVAPAPAIKEHMVVVVLSDHLDRSERLLVELKHADADSQQMVSPIRDEARSLLSRQIRR